MARKRWKQKTEYGKTRFGTRGTGTPNAKGKRRPLTYFYNLEQWEAARKSPEFQAWARRQQQPPPEIRKITIEARPVMQLAKEQIDKKIPDLWEKAAKQVNNPGSGKRSFGARYAKIKGRGF